MLIFNLKKQWFEKIKSGEKTTEFREVKPYWSQRLTGMGADCTFHRKCIRPDGCYEFETYTSPCIFRLGYSSAGEFWANITSIEIVNGKDTDLGIDKDVYAIHFELT